MPIQSTNKDLLITEGIVIRTYASGDSDLVLRIISREEAKISAMAKRTRSASKKGSWRFDLFDRGLFSLATGRGSLFIIKEFNPTLTPRALRNDLDKMTSASLVCESFDLLVHEHSGDGTDCFNTLALGLEAIDQATSPQEILRALYYTLSNLVEYCGFSAIDNKPAPSSKSLNDIILKIEQISERGLNSKTSVLEIVQRLKTNTKPISQI